MWVVRTASLAEARQMIAEIEQFYDGIKETCGNDLDHRLELATRVNARDPGTQAAGATFSSLVCV